MEKKESKEVKERVNLNLSFLDLFPSYEEIDEHNEGIIITFQNSDLTYNLLELVKNRDKLFVPQLIPNQTIKMNLIKSNALYASGPLTVKNGEQWVTFAYEHKKKQTTNFALSLIDCIKIKFFCTMNFVPALHITNTINNQLANTEVQSTKNDSILNNISSRPSPKKLYGSFTTKKKQENSNNINNNNNVIDNDSLQIEELKSSKIFENTTPEAKPFNTNNNLNNTILNSSKNTTHNPLVKSDNFSEFNHLGSSSGVVGKDFKFDDKKKGKNMKKTTGTNFNTNNSLSLDNRKGNEGKSWNQKKKNSNKNLTKEKTKINNNSINNMPSANDTNNKSKQNLKRNKSKSLIDNKNKTDKKMKDKDKDRTAKFLSNNNINNNNDSKLKKMKKDFSPKNANAKNKELIESKEENITGVNNIFNKNNSIEINNIESLIKEDDDNLLLYKNSMNLNNESKTIPPIVDEYPDEFDEGLDNFSKKLEDFHLLYSDGYIKSITEEDYALEIELYIEKLIELITEYHIQIEEKDLEYKILKSTYYKNVSQFLDMNKLCKKLELIKDDYDLKKNSPKPVADAHDNNYINNLITNKVEINMFNYLFYTQKESDNKAKKEKIKKILQNLLSKPKIKNILNPNEKISKWIKLNIADKTSQGKDKVKKKNKQVKTLPDTNNNKGGNKTFKKKKSNNNINNTPSKNKNKSNNKTIQEDKGKKK